MTVRQQGDIQVDIEACRARIATLGYEIGDLQTDENSLREQINDVQDQTQQKAAKLQKENARLANLEVELQSSP
jgi:predicted  nucleic acid-binding Zn-ribbon protein